MADGANAAEAVSVRFRLPLFVQLCWLRWALSGCPGSGSGLGVAAALAGLF